MMNLLATRPMSINMTEIEFRKLNTIEFVFGKKDT